VDVHLSTSQQAKPERKTTMSYGRHYQTAESMLHDLGPHVTEADTPILLQALAYAVLAVADGTYGISANVS
jgi:hypothetical protein